MRPGGRGTHPGILHSRSPTPTAPRGERLSPSLWGKAEKAAQFRCRSRGVAGESRVHGLSGAAPAPDSGVSTTPEPPRPRRPSPAPAASPRPPRPSGARPPAPPPLPGAPPSPRAETGGVTPDPGRPQPGPPSPRALTSARDADSRRTSWSWATARAAGAARASARRAGGGAGAEARAPIGRPRRPAPLASSRPRGRSRSPAAEAWVIHSRLVHLLLRLSPSGLLASPSSGPGTGPSAATVHQDNPLVCRRPCVSPTPWRLCQYPKCSGGASARCPSPPFWPPCSI